LRADACIELDGDEDTLMNAAALKVQPLTQPSYKIGLRSKISTTQVFFKFF